MDVSDLLKFYTTSLGGRVHEVLSQLINGLWPSTVCDTFLCHGFPFPFLKDIKLRSQRTIIFMEPQVGVINWLPHGKNMTALVDDKNLPLSNDCIDRAILIHSLEFCQNPKAFLREIWRVLSPEGRAIIIVPNRRSLWSHLDYTPLGHGNPYSMGQLSQLIKDNQFDICQKARGLYGMPSSFWQGGFISRVTESIHKKIAPKLSGIVAIEVKKSVYCGSLPKARNKLFITPSPMRAKLSSREDLG